MTAGDIRKETGEGNVPPAPKERASKPQGVENELLALADDLAAKALDDELPISEVWKAAKAYQKARGI